MEKNNMLPGVFTAVLVANGPRHAVTTAQAAGKGVPIPFLSYSTQRTKFLYVYFASFKSHQNSQLHRLQ